MDSQWGILPDPTAFGQAMERLWEAYPNLPSVILLFGRFALVILAAFTVWGCLASLLRERHEPESWGDILAPNDQKLPIRHWENVIGRAPSSDIRLAFSTVSRSHAALIRDDAGDWELVDLAHKGSLARNNRPVEGRAALSPGDSIRVGGVSLVFRPSSPQELGEQTQTRPRPGRLVRPWMILLWLTEFQILLCGLLTVTAGERFTWLLPMTFACLSLAMWTYFLFVRALRRTGFEIEGLGFFLTTLGLAVTATARPQELAKQFAAVLLGLVCFLVLCVLLRRQSRAVKLRWPMAAGALGLLAFTLLFGSTQYGAKNWVLIGGLSVQPSELAKIAFIYAGTATLDRLFARRNLILFIVLAGACVGLLALMSDFGTALIFFVTFLVIAFLRSGDLATIALACAGAGFAGFLALEFKPYVARRFLIWRHAWEDAYNGGFQQTRTMSAAASGGFFGMGPGTGWLKTIGAADTDLVFGILCEELGLLIALMAVASVAILAVFAVRSAATGRSTFYVIAACAATSMLVVQTMLNVCGSVDILPLTGVTFPFVSNGGSSMVSAWGMLAFIKAADTRQNASIAIPLPKWRKTHE